LAQVFSRIVKRVIVGAAALVIALIAAVVVRFYVLAPTYRPAPIMAAPTSAEAVARGQYLVHHVAACVACHSTVDETISGEPVVPGKLGSGRDFGEFPGYPVHVRSGNLTADKKTGLGSWTDGEIARATREGVSRDGRPLFPEMPYRTYRETLGDGEMLDIIAYLRTLPPIENAPGPTSIDFPISMLLRKVPRPLGATPPPAPSPADKLARGKWILAVASCHDCHDAVDGKMQKIEGKELAGGLTFPLPKEKGHVFAANLTSDKATGIGAYSDEDLRRAIDEGRGKDGRTLYVMPWAYYKGMTSEDKSALIAALRDVPPVPNAVPPSGVRLE
jgi:mono/diheme cytochrome c family protein